MRQKDIPTFMKVIYVILCSIMLASFVLWGFVGGESAAVTVVGALLVVGGAVYFFKRRGDDPSEVDVKKIRDEIMQAAQRDKLEQK